MNTLINFIRLTWIRLFSGDTPLFFKYWGYILSALVIIGTVLTAQLATAPERVKESYETEIWIYNTIVAILGALTPFMATRNRDLGQDDFESAIQSAKHEKGS